MKTRQELKEYMDKPNPHQTWEELDWELTQDLEWFGHSYEFQNKNSGGVVCEVVALDPTKMMVIKDKDRKITGIKDIYDESFDPNDIILISQYPDAP